jgi:hypothetical protein
MHVALPCAVGAGQLLHTAPPMPQALDDAVVTHCPVAQQPEQLVPSHAQIPLEQCSPAGHDPLAQTPLQPSFAPHALPTHVGVHPQMLALPPPPHEPGAAH